MNRFLNFFFGKPSAPVTLAQTAEKPGCTNCGAELSGPFCSNCGQKKEHKHDFTVWHFIGHSFHEFTHFDSRFFRSFKYLISKPAYLTEEFIIGHRKNYINPIRLFIIVNLIYLLLPAVNTFTTPLSLQMQGRNHRWIQPMVENKIKETGISYNEYEREFNNKIKEHAEMLIICMVIVFSVLLSLLYFTQHRYYIEHLILSLNIYSILLILLSIGMIAFEFLLTIFLILYEKIAIITHLADKTTAIDNARNILIKTGNDTFLSYAMTISMFVFLFIALKRIYRESNFATFIKGAICTYSLFWIIMLYRILLFYTTFYTLH